MVNEVLSQNGNCDFPQRHMMILPEFRPVRSRYLGLLYRQNVRDERFIHKWDSRCSAEYNKGLRN